MKKKVFFALMALVLVSVISCSCNNDNRYEEDDYVYESDYLQRSRVRVSIIKRVDNVSGRGCHRMQSILLEDGMVLEVFFSGHDLYENQLGKKLKKKYAPLFLEPGDTVFYEKVKNGFRIREVKFKD